MQVTKALQDQHITLQSSSYFQLYLVKITIVNRNELPNPIVQY